MVPLKFADILNIKVLFNSKRYTFLFMLVRLVLSLIFMSMTSYNQREKKPNKANRKNIYELISVI